MSKLISIKTKYDVFFPQEAGVKDESKRFGNYPICKIKKLFFGIWVIDYFDENSISREKGYSFGDENKPNTRIILYPSVIEEIKYSLE